jgi:citrate lyase subunit beta/citryl-CoA lyase
MSVAAAETPCMRGPLMSAPTTVPPLTWLYVPGDRPERVEKAFASQAHAVIVDLEDAVAPGAKAEARRQVAELLDRPRDRLALVRVNGLATPWWREDVETAAELPVAGIVLPKVESPADVDAVAAVPSIDGRLHCLLETALGIENAFTISSHPAVVRVSLGEADLGADLAVEASGLDWARSRVVNAARAAGLPRPPQSVYAAIGDAEGLAASCAHGRALGHLGRAAIHPSQLPVILDAYRPTRAEVERARELLAAFAARADEGVGAFVVGDRFVDAAVVRSAELTSALADAYGVREG